MGESQQFKAGDILKAPVVFQVLKAFGEEDRVFYLCTALDQKKRCVCLREPFFVLCTEPDGTTDLPDIPATIQVRIEDFVNKAIEDEAGRDEGDDSSCDDDSGADDHEG